MSAPNVPPRRVSMSYLLGFSKTPFKDPKPPPAYHGPRPGGLGDMVSTPGGIVEWAASDGRKGRLNGPDKTRALSEGAPKGPSGKGEQAANGKQTEKKEEAQASGEDADEDDNPHGFTKAEDEKMIEWKTANPGKPWTDFGDEIGKSGPQCKERYKQISSKDGNQNAGQQQGGKGGGGGQQNQQPRKLTNKEKKALKHGGGGGQNQNEGQWNNQNNGQNSGGDAKKTGNSNAGKGDSGNDSWDLAGFDMPLGGDDEKKSEGGNNDPTNTWGATTTSGNAADNAGWPTGGATKGWDGGGGGGGGGDNSPWDNNNGGGSTKSGGKKKDKDKKDKGNGSQKAAEDAWGQKNDTSGGSNPGWGGDTGGADLWGNSSNKSGGGKSGGSSNKAASQGGWATGDNDAGGGGGGDWAATDGAADGAKAWGEQNDKSAHHHSSHGQNLSKDRTTAPLELEVKPDETFSADDLRLVARILQQDYQMVWQRVSWRFKDKTGRNVPPEVFEKKITGRVEGEERERSERKRRR